MQYLLQVTLETTSEPALKLIKNSSSGLLSCPFNQYASSLIIASEACSAVSSPTPLNPTAVHTSSFLHNTPLGFLFSRQEPLIFFNFDINPNTSVFSTTFVVAVILQILGFYIFRHFVPQLTDKNPKSKRGLSWVLTLFSSLVLFTGAFTLTSKMEWNPSYRGMNVVEGGDQKYARTLLSLQKFPLESDLATMYSAYFVSYLICDLVLGIIYYRAYLDPLSGWAHHLGYLGVVSNAASQGNVSTLFAIGTPIEGMTNFETENSNC